MPKIDFKHSQSAHCENGVTSNLLRYHDLHVSEPMVFGIGSGLFFSYLPFIKLNYLPVTSYRILPGMIFSRAARRLGVKMKIRKFRNPEKAMAELDKMLALGIPVGLQTSVFYLPYLPKQLRFHFNAHNIVVYGKENACPDKGGGYYSVSDPGMEQTSLISYDDLVRARFAKGIAAPRGKMYYPTEVPTEANLKEAIIKGIRQTANDMLNVPFNYFGIIK